MTVEVFLILLGFFGTLSSLTTQAIKTYLESVEKTYVSNRIVLIVSLILGVGGVFTYYVLKEIDITLVNCIYAVLMGFANWLVAMVGYDKISQLISQIKGV